MEKVIIGFLAAYALLMALYILRYMRWLNKAQPKMLAVVPVGTKPYMIDSVVADPNVCVVDVLMSDDNHYIFKLPVEFINLAPGRKKMLARQLARTLGKAQGKLLMVHWYYNKGFEM